MIAVHFYIVVQAIFALMHILGFVLAAVMMMGVNAAYSQSDDIPGWVKGVAGFWVEGKITDLEFIEAIEFLITHDIIRAADSLKIQELENEIADLKQKIHSLESTKIDLSKEIKTNTQNKLDPHVMIDKLEPYIMTDKSKYALRDTILVNGRFAEFEPLISLDGTAAQPNRLLMIQITNVDNWHMEHQILCDVPAYILVENCKITDDGIILSEFPIDKKTVVGTYKVHLFTTNTENFEMVETISQPFTIQ